MPPTNQSTPTIDVDEVLTKILADNPGLSDEFEFDDTLKNHMADVLNESHSSEETLDLEKAIDLVNRQLDVARQSRIKKANKRVKSIGWDTKGLQGGHVPPQD